MTDTYAVFDWDGELVQDGFATEEEAVEFLMLNDLSGGWSVDKSDGAEVRGFIEARNNLKGTEE